ncbi:PHP domain-containing protein [Kitasatospora sp. NPDC008050]|uniref:PHP domain-containing protein n=1 Tax=Kitasatospora sp. NPDC008050 TaxID=3364021 RepID=UPI0036E42115
MRIDLHAHSNVSDGTDTPSELIAAAVAAGLDVVALTDHDTVAGHAEAAAALRALPPGRRPTLVPGAELSCRVEGISMHLLAYLFDPAEPEFARERELVRTDRFRRGQAVVERCRELGAPITWEQVQRIAAGGSSVGRPHIASALVEAGVVKDVSAAFTTEWLANGGRADVPKHETDPAVAVRLVRAAGGVPVFAHPGADKRGRTVSDQVIADLAAAGLAGLEVDHIDHDEPARARLRTLAAELGLFTTGSSDYHGSRKTVRLGEFTTSPEAYQALLHQATGAKPID